MRIVGAPRRDTEQLGHEHLGPREANDAGRAVVAIAEPLVCERVGTKHTKHFDGPVLTGNADADAAAFVDAFMELIVPTKVQNKKDRQW